VDRRVDVITTLNNVKERLQEISNSI